MHTFHAGFLIPVCIIALVVFMSVAAALPQSPANKIVLDAGFKFHTGDDLQWANPDFDDNKWPKIKGDRLWEYQGYKDYDGYAWYRIKVFIPSAMRQKAFYKDSLLICLGRIDDTDQTFLNGRMIGQNGKRNDDGSEFINHFTRDRKAYGVYRRYALPANDARILWNRDNTIAIRVHDHGGGGGLYGPSPHISMVDLADTLKIETNLSTFEFCPNSAFRKTIILKNVSRHDEFGGDFHIKIAAPERCTVLDSTLSVVLPPGSEKSIAYSFLSSHATPHTAIYTFVEQKTKTTISAQQKVPYLLTPAPPEAPRVNGPKIYGVRPESPFLYRIPATGKRPMTFRVQNLPVGLRVDRASGIITGKIDAAGEYRTVLEAKNKFGKSTRDFKIVVGDKLALTPPMGWNSWYIHYDRVSDAVMRRAADAMIASGMADYGYQYINIDDCWMVKANSDDPLIGGRLRDDDGRLLSNKKFPNMKAMTDYIHAKGLKAGIYISPGPTTCAGYAGSYEHEQQDAETFADWGFDFLKYDWCSYGRIAQGNSVADLKAPYEQMWGELQKLHRDIVLNLCQYGMGEVWTWGGDVGNSWRTTGDLGLESGDDMPGFYRIGISNAQHWQYAAPGAWNDPDYLLLGWVGSARKMGVGELTRLTPDEQYFYMSMWSLMAAPLIFSGDMARLDAFTLNVLCNNEVIEVNQDALGKQAAIQRNANNEFVMVKELEDGSKAVGLFNLDDQPKKIALTWAELRIAGKISLRDLWRQKDLGVFEGGFEHSVPPHGVALLKLNEIKE